MRVASRIILAQGRPGAIGRESKIWAGEAADCRARTQLATESSLARQRRRRALQVAAIDDALHKEPCVLRRIQGSELGSAEGPVESAVLAAAGAQPGSPAGQRLYIEVRRLRLRPEVVLEQVKKAPPAAVINPPQVTQGTLGELDSIHADRAQRPYESSAVDSSASSSPRTLASDTVSPAANSVSADPIPATN